MVALAKFALAKFNTLISLKNQKCACNVLTADDKLLEEILSWIELTWILVILQDIDKILNYTVIWCQVIVTEENSQKPQVSLMTEL